MNIFGINAVYHESAAALLVGGKLVAAVEEERFNRIKHGREANFDNPHQFPERAIRYCLKHAGLTGANIDHFAYSFDPAQRRKQYRAEWWDPKFEEPSSCGSARSATSPRRFSDGPLQEDTNAAVMALERRVKRRAPFDRLCIAGGVALNCVTNEVIRHSDEFAEIFIPSAPHDAGTAIGAAMHCAKTKQPPQRGYSTPYLGPAFGKREIAAAVKSAGLAAKQNKSPARDAAKMIADGKIVAWFQGRMEFGPRALGNRSLLADPRRTCATSSIGKLGTARISGPSRRA